MAIQFYKKKVSHISVFIILIVSALIITKSLSLRLPITLTSSVVARVRNREKVVGRYLLSGSERVIKAMRRVHVFESPTYTREYKVTC